ncbi:MAG: Asp-tRNA(Asn)/Glu-tRNA(Gln) amidotransferase GatCAB subunit B [Candidatus Methanomethylicota archaeon]|uniref:Aspartyl/glutamyl-tRNA(Asn/Gln) amidotransferase subunit B n=1 Tax=Thermoproteota archaeon TaxID=2056631 RepID=A0A497ETH0_9CREN|nr:MAG: Asp-tRNA(Asn)/Glu-tRNA(Gln) amidotransferase GatCAB subunit B [Candidatus Verstraetearchaeota archaeon]
MSASYPVTIGLEVHCQLTSLKTKLFCSCPADYRGKPPNTHVCPVCLGLPGSLPVLNRKAVEYAVMAALALNCKLNRRCILVRKNYFYVDMAKNFQISMYEKAGGSPIGVDGYITINVDGQKKRIGIYRIQLEEDPARLVHMGPIDLSPYTLVDYNRSGIALLEIVTKPELHSPREARLFLQKLRSILEHLGIFDGSLEGSMRCDANISIQGGGRVEIKNISSFKEVERALNFEISRQTELVKKGLSVERETRHWDEARRITITLRAKEEEYDYRYFPEPDLLPVDLTDEFIESVKAKMPELPDARAERFIKQYGLPEYDAAVLTGDKALADFFEACVKNYPDAKKVSNWIMGDLLGVLHELDMDLNESKITPDLLVEMLKLIDQGVISGKIGKYLLPRMVKEGKRPSEIVAESGLTRLADRASLEELVEKVFRENPKAVKDALMDEKAIHFLIGQVMKATRGRADPQITNELVRSKLAELKSKQIHVEV